MLVGVSCQPLASYMDCRYETATSAVSSPASMPVLQKIFPLRLIIFPPSSTSTLKVIRGKMWLSCGFVVSWHVESVAITVNQGYLTSYFIRNGALFPTILMFVSKSRATRTGRLVTWAAIAHAHAMCVARVILQPYAPPSRRTDTFILVKIENNFNFTLELYRYVVSTYSLQGILSADAIAFWTKSIHWVDE